MKISALFLSSTGLSCSSTVASGQPFALELLRGMLWLFDDVDVDLPRLLEAGASTGVAAHHSAFRGVAAGGGARTPACGASHLATTLGFSAQGSG